MSTNCAFCENGLFRVHLFGDSTRSHVSATEVCTVFDHITETWDKTTDAEYIDIIFRNKTMPFDQQAVTWPDQKSASTYLWMNADVTGQTKKERAFTELMSRFSINDFNLRSHSRKKEEQSCFTMTTGCSPFIFLAIKP